MSSLPGPFRRSGNSPVFDKIPLRFFWSRIDWRRDLNWLIVAWLLPLVRRGNRVRADYVFQLRLFLVLPLVTFLNTEAPLFIRTLRRPFQGSSFNLLAEGVVAGILRYS